jgi:hypothetical protein
MQRFYQSESAETEPKTYVSTNYLGILCLALLALLIIINCLPISFEMKVPIFTGLSLLGVLITIFGGIFQKLKIQINKPIVFAPEQFEGCFRDMISKALKKRNIVNNTYTKIVDYVEVGECSITNLDQLVLVIDNIDRCSSSQAYNLLTDIKTFLCDEKFNLVFVIPVDDEALRKHILNSTHSENTDECARDKEEFLRKFFNVTLRIKPHQPTEMYEFAQKLNTNRNNIRWYLNNCYDIKTRAKELPIDYEAEKIAKRHLKGEKVRGDISNLAKKFEVSRQVAHQRVEFAKEKLKNG